MAVPLPQSKLRNLNVKDFKANGGAILKRMLDSDGYLFVGELPAPTGSPTELAFIDTKGQPRVPFAYRIVAMNSDQLGSIPSAPLDATALKVRCETPQSFTPTLDAAGDSPQIRLAWQVSPRETPAKYILERASERLTPPPNSANARVQQLKLATKIAPLTFVTLATLESATQQFTDVTVRSGRKYTYRLRAVDSEGLFSDALTKAIIVPALTASSFGDPAPSPPLPAPVKPLPVEPVGELLSPSKSAQFGKWYRYDTGNRWAFSILKAEYTTQPFVWGPKDSAKLFYPTPEEKFIKLTLTVKNIGTDTYEFGYQSLIGHAVSADGNSSPDFQHFKRTDNGNQSSQLLPAGKTTTVEPIVTVSAMGAAKALQVGETSFPLGEGNTVASLPPFLSKDGATIAAEVSAQRGQAYPGARFEAAFVGLARSMAAFGELTLEEGKEFVIVSVALKNKALEESKAEYQTFTLTLYDNDDDKYTADKPYKETKPEQVTSPLSPTATEGDTRVVRYLFTIPKGTTLKRMTLRESDARTYVYPQGELK